MTALIISVIAGVLILTGCGFYFIPKYAMHTNNAWITAIDSAIYWIGANWIVFTILAVLFVIVVILLVVVFKKRKK